MEENGIRINKFLSEAGVCSRREADRQVELGNITDVYKRQASERVFEFLEEEEEEQIVEHPADVSKITGAVTFDHVHFGYNPEQIIINDFSASVKPGQKIAIVGPTGAGKSTMVKLLMRFYDVNSGAICLDGHNIKDFNRRELRDAFGMVLLDTWLFKGTIMENIRYGRLDATDEEVIAAAKAARADHFIKTLPGGYQMELNEDASNVSQGQKPVSYTHLCGGGRLRGSSGSGLF